MALILGGTLIAILLGDVDMAFLFLISGRDLFIYTWYVLAWLETDVVFDKRTNSDYDVDVCW